jgi:hypothetical protein
MAKPIPEHTYLGYLRILGWKMVKGGMDYNLFHKERLMCSIKIIHGKGKKREISPSSVIPKSVPKLESGCVGFAS